jgi:VWFA-related protein
MNINGFFKKDFFLIAGWAAAAGALLLGSGINPKLAIAQAGQASTLRVNVELATVEVSVKDKKGQPIKDLKKENFELLINGKRQEVVTFDAVSETGAAQPVPTSLKDIDEGTPLGKVVMIIFDDHTIALPQIKVTRDAAATYVKRHMHPQDQFAVAIYSRDFNIIQPFTHDTAKVLAAIAKPAASFGQSQLGVGFSGQEGQLLAKNIIVKMTTLASDLAPIKGRKALLFFTEDFAVMAETEMNTLIETARRSKVSFYTLISKNASASASNRLKPALKSSQTAKTMTTVGKTFVPPAAFSFLQLAQAVLPNINFLSAGTTTLMLAAMPQATPPNPAHPTGPDGSGSGIADHSARDDFDRISKANISGAIMQAVAKETFGDVVRESNDLTKGLEGFNVELSNYYVLGYLPANLKQDDKLLKVEIKTNVKDAKLVYARGTFLTKESGHLEITANEKKLTTLLTSPVSANGIQLEMRPVVFYDSPQLARVTLFGRVKAGAASAPPGKLEFMGAAYDMDGNIVGRFYGSKTVSAPVGANSATPDEVYYQNQLLVKPGKYQLKMAVMNDAGKSSNQSLPLEVPALTESSMGASSLVLSSRVTPLPDLVKNVQVQLLNETNPMAFKGYEITPSVDNRVDRKLPLAVFYKIYNLKPAGPERVLMAKPRLIDEKGQTHDLPAIKLTRVVQPSGPGQVTLGFNFPVRDLQPGKYRLSIETVDSTNNQSATCQTNVELQ